MNRYHRKVFYPQEAGQELESITKELNSIKDEPVDIKSLLLYIKDLKINSENIFEYYKDNDYIAKICVRFDWKNESVILCLTANKTLVSVWINSVEDTHETLKKELYVSQ